MIAHAPVLAALCAILLPLGSGEVGYIAGGSPESTALFSIEVPIDGQPVVISVNDGESPADVAHRAAVKCAGALISSFTHQP